MKILKVGNSERLFSIFVPPNLPKEEKIPFVFVFHGGGGDGESIKNLTKFNRLAEKEKFIVAYPEAIGNNWNDGRENETSQSYLENIDDVAFVEALIDLCIKDYGIDEKRIFATGLSNGACFSYYLAANLSEKIAAIAPVAGGIADPFYQQIKLVEPISIFIIQGTSDPFAPYGGGEIAPELNSGKSRGKVIGTTAAIQLWIDQIETKKDAIIGSLPDLDETDGCTVETYLWTGGKNETEIKFFKINGGGHTWAGGEQFMPKNIFGNVCRDFDATELIWGFFKQHPKA